MKELLAGINPATKKAAVFGFAIVAALVIASAVLHFGAGRPFDYFAAKNASEALLSLSRPAGVGVCLWIYLIEYRKRRSNDY